MTAAATISPGRIQFSGSPGVVPTKASKLVSASTNTTKSAIEEATAAASWDSVASVTSLCRRRYTTTATEVSAIRKMTPRAPTLVSQANRLSTGSLPRIAKTAISTTAIAVCASEPAIGAPLAFTLASMGGSTPSRPREKKYRATELWKDSSAANRLVTNSTVATSANHLPTFCSAYVNNNPAVSSWDLPMIWVLPTAITVAQAEKA